MNLNMEIIAEELHENYHLYPLDRTIDRTELISARILGRESMPSDSHLYIADIQTLEQYPYRNMLTHVISCEDCREFLQSDCNFLQIDSKTDAVALLSRVQDIFDRYRIFEDQVKDCGMAYENLTVLLNQFSAFLGNPIALFDASLYLFLKSELYTDTLSGVWEHSLQEGAMEGSVRRIICNPDALKRMDSENMPYLICPKNEQEALVCRVKINEKSVFTAVLIAANRSIGEADKWVMRYFTDVVSILLHRKVFMKLTDNSVLERHLNRMCRGISVSKALLRSDLKKYGWEDSAYYLCVFQSENIHEEGLAEDVLRLLFPMALITSNAMEKYSHGTLNEQIMMLKASEEFDLDALLSQMEELADKHRLTCGVSLRFHDASLSGMYYQNVCEAMEWNKDGRVTNYSEFREEHRIGILSRTTDIRRFIHPDALKLYLDDIENGGVLLESLYRYLCEGKSLTKASKVLSIHRNTLVYRLENIEKKSSFRTDDDTECDAMKDSYRIIRFLEKQKESDVLHR
ncbi:MAG: PucR family transcriptional regulator [Anaerofustis sp.]